MLGVVMRGEKEFKERIRALVQPSPTEIVRVKRHLCELLSEGKAHRTGWLQRRVLEIERITPEARREQLEVAANAEIETVVVRDHPVIARRRILAATVEAIADLQSQGVIVPAEESKLQEEDQVPPVQGPDQVPYQFGGHSAAVHGILAGRPTLPSAYVLVQSYRSREAWFLDVDVFVADLSDLALDPRTIRSLQECLVAYRRGLYLAAANLLGAAVEGAWYSLAEELRGRDSRLARPLDGNDTANVQRLVAEHLGSTKADLLAHAVLMRDLRNYGVHPRATGPRRSSTTSARRRVAS